MIINGVTFAVGAGMCLMFLIAGIFIGKSLEQEKSEVR